MNTALPGTLNGHLIGIAMKEMVRRAIASIARNRVVFEATEKHNHKKGKDFFTTADTAAQGIYLRVISESFPGFGVIAEEDNLSVPCREPDVDIYFTVDPLDGTNAFIRRQSHGIGTMISLVCNGEVVAACVGDVMTKEIYYFRPGSDKVHRFSLSDEIHEVLSIEKRTLRTQYVLLGDHPAAHCRLIREIVRPQEKGGLFKNIEISGGSIGVRMARLWKGEVGSIMLKAGICTPWDWSPIYGISQKLGFRFLKTDDGFHWVDMTSIGLLKQVEDWPFDVAIIHRSNVSEFLDFLKKVDRTCS